MRYYADDSNNVYAFIPEGIEVTEITSGVHPITGEPLKSSEYLSNLERNIEGELYAFYKQDGSPDITRITEQEQTAFRAERDIQISKVLPVLSQYQNEQEQISLGILSSGKYSQEQYIEALAYLQELKDAPDSWVMPVKPEWI
jgi:hypothetical protein